MKNYIKFSFYLALYFSICFLNQKNAIAESTSLAEICTIPADAYEMQKISNESLKQITYKLQLKYPAQEILNFYENEFKSKKFIPMETEWLNSRKWCYFIDSTKKEKPSIYLFEAAWSDRSKTIRIQLMLRYTLFENLSEKEAPSNLEVFCLVLPFHESPPE